MRKHFYLITEHENEDRVGLISILDRQLSQVTKNEEGPLQRFNENTGEFSTPGKQVGLGYADFDGEDDYKARVGDVIDRKLHEVDAEYRAKAGVEAAADA